MQIEMDWNLLCKSYVTYDSHNFINCQMDGGKIKMLSYCTDMQAKAGVQWLTHLSTGGSRFIPQARNSMLDAIQMKFEIDIIPCTNVYSG